MSNIFLLKCNSRDNHRVKRVRVITISDIRTMIQSVFLTVDHNPSLKAADFWSDL